MRFRPGRLTAIRHAPGRAAAGPAARAVRRPVRGYLASRGGNHGDAAGRRRVGAGGRPAAGLLRPVDPDGRDRLLEFRDRRGDPARRAQPPGRGRAVPPQPGEKLDRAGGDRHAGVQRGHRPRVPPSAEAAGLAGQPGRGRPLRGVPAVRQLGSRNPRRRAAPHARLAARRCRRGGPPALPPPRRQSGLQGRQPVGVCRNPRRRLRLPGGARRRQRDARPHGRPAGPDHGRQPQARHPAVACRRNAQRKRVRPDLPVRHAPRHAGAHRGRCLVAGRRLPLLGP